MANFDLAVTRVLLHEGGLATDWRDKGGATKFGISTKQYPLINLDTLTLDEAKAIYQKDYWLPIWDRLTSQALASSLLDMAVNASPHQAVLLFQRAVLDCGKAVIVDGVFGEATLQAANALPEADLLRAYRQRRIQHYALLAVNDRTQVPFLFGWIGRALS